MHLSLCVCPLIPSPPLQTRTRLVVVMHRLEAKKTTNTGRLAAACLANSQVIVRGYADRPEPPVTWPDDSQPILLFPFEDAIPIERFASSVRPITLVVPDGTWRQASKVRNRVAGMKDVPCVSLPAGEKTSYRLRTESHEDGLATIEAVARAFRVLEGAAVEETICRVFRAMVDRTLWSRGDLATENVRGGIPEGAERHDPASGAR